MGIMTRATDHTGKRYGLLQAVRPLPERDSKKQIVWQCVCDCGSTVNLPGPILTKGQISCGCKKGGATHRLCEHPLYVTWSLIRYRVNTPTCPAYRHYGGRGISYDPRWNDFEKFLLDVGERPPNPEGHFSKRSYWSIDRIDPDGNYEPGNIRWATPSEQARNRSKMKAR